MIPSVYVVGGAGTGKSTFMETLLKSIGATMGPLEDLHAKPNKKNVVTLRGHRLADGGLYIGCMRDSFPGTDGLDRASSVTAEEWLDLGLHTGPVNGPATRYIVAEGATLATRRFISALHRHTDLLLVYLHADDFVKELRFAERGSAQAESFVKTTATRSLNLWAEYRAQGVATLDVDTSDPNRWAYALGKSLEHVLS